MTKPDRLPGLSDETLDSDYEGFLKDTERAVINGDIVNPFIVLFLHSNRDGKHNAYIEIESPGNEAGAIQAVLEALEQAGKVFAEKGSLPYMSMFGSVGHAEKYGIERIDELGELSLEIEERMKAGEVTEDSLMTAAMVIDGRKRATISFFIAPPDGGLVLDRRVRLDSSSGFLVGEGIDVFDLCMAPFIGAAKVLGEDD